MSYKSLRKTRAGLVHVFGYCENCDWQVGSKNGVGLAAQHTDRTGHTTRVETGYAITFHIASAKEYARAEED